MASSNGRRSHGRVLVHQRETDDSVPILGSALAEDVHEAVLNDAIHDTISKGMTHATRRNYRSRLFRFIRHLEVHFPDYFGVGVRQLNAEEKADRTKYHFEKTEDLVYSGFNVKYLLYFLASTETREDGKLKGFDDIRKYRDAVLWGSKVAGERLPSNFFDGTETYLNAYKKKWAQAKKQGNVEEHSTDPIPLPVYRFLLRRSIQTNNVFAWTWTLLQWNCMARSASIDSLGFHNFSLGLDSLVVKYDDSKADKAGEKLSEKNLYANPLDWTMCTWLGLGVFCCINKGNLSVNERLFLKDGTKEGAGSTKYHEQVVGLVRGMENSISPHMKVEKLNPYGLRKGAATHAVSGTTAAPSIPSIARRGEWSIGSVLDIYWHFGSVGDHYLGRILCGLDPNDPNFAVLPPHWKVDDPLGNPAIQEAMQSMFGPILQQEGADQRSGILLRCLACIVFHSKNLSATMVEYPGHDFTKLTILHNVPLLNELKDLVTIEPTKGVLVAPTGIPPHIGLAVQVAEVLDTLGDLVRQFGEHGDNLMLAVEEALENKAWEGGHITGSKLKEILESFQKDSLKSVDQHLQGMRVELREAIRRQGQGGDAEGDDLDFFGTMVFDDHPDGTGGGGGGSRKVNKFSYDGRFFAVPKGYQFPKANLSVGLRCWLKDQNVSVEGNEVVKAYRLLSPAMLPPSLAKSFRTNWLPIFKYLEPVLGGVPRNIEVSEEEIEKLLEACMVFLKERLSYLWKDRSNPREFSVGTWSNKCSYGSVLKYGTQGDKSYLKEPTKRNKTKQQQGTRKRPMKPHTKHPTRQDRSIRKKKNAAATEGQQQPVVVVVGDHGSGNGGGSSRAVVRRTVRAGRGGAWRIMVLLQLPLLT